MTWLPPALIRTRVHPIDSCGVISPGTYPELKPDMCGWRLSIAMEPCRKSPALTQLPGSTPHRAECDRGDYRTVPHALPQQPAGQREGTPSRPLADDHYDTRSVLRSLLLFIIVQLYCTSYSCSIPVGATVPVL